MLLVENWCLFVVSCSLRKTIVVKTCDYKNKSVINSIHSIMQTTFTGSHTIRLSNIIAHLFCCTVHRNWNFLPLNRVFVGLLQFIVIY